jgi:hypothetical protein
MREVVVVAGAIAQRPGNGGHAWVFLQYLLGFRRLGYDVIFVDRLSQDMLKSGESWPPGSQSPYIAWLTDVMASQGLEDSFSLLLGEDGQKAVGMSRRNLSKRLRASVFLLDVMGFLGDEALLAEASRRVFLDIDPGFPQMWSALDLHDSFREHDIYATVGLRIGEEDCAVPSCGIEWVKTPQPVVLDKWQPSAGGDTYTSVASWRGPFEPVDYRGQRYGLRAHQMRRFAELPAISGKALEVALDIDPADVDDKVLLRNAGWSLKDPGRVAGSVEDYHCYIQGSRGEVGVAKDMYVRSHCGWLSDRSICYLASGKPVLAQATGFESVYETGEGLLAFETLEQAVEGLAEIERRYEHHCQAARELAVECFDSDIVLSRLVEAVA